MKKFICFLTVLSFLFSAAAPVFAAETYYLRDVNDGASTEVSMSEYETYQTEHFQIFYGTTGANSAKVTDAYLKKCETVLENCWDLYIDKMGMEPTSTSINYGGDKTTKYKTNVILMGTGIRYYDLGADEWGAYGSVDSAGYPYFMCCLAAMDSPTVVAHEFGHAVHYAQGDNAWKDNIYLGPWFEAVANWFAEQYVYEYIPGTTQLSHLYLRASSLTKMNGRAYYEAWPILQYLTENPDGYEGYGRGFVQKLLSYNSGSTSTLFWEILAACNKNVSVYDTVGSYASHMATMDFERKDLYNRAIESAYNYRVFFWQQRYTVPEPFGEEADTYCVPPERAPQAMGYNIVPLDFTPGYVSVTLKSLSSDAGASFRARLVKEDKNGSVSYSDLFKEGETGTIEASEGDTLYLSVAATPSLSSMARHTITGWAEHSKESNYPCEKKTQYPYSVTLSGAKPMERPSVSTAGMHRHPNGGGWVSDSANVAASAYVGENALVLGYATVSGNAVIDGNAIVSGNAVVTDNAYVGDNAVIFDRAKVSGNARVIESACIYVDYSVSGSAVVKGQALGLLNGSATGDAVLYGDWFDDEGVKVSDGSFSGWHSITTDSSYAAKNGDYYTRGCVKHLKARYEFNSDSRDSVGFTDLYGINNPTITEKCALLDGESCFLLDSSVLYYDNMRIALSAKGEGEILSVGGEISLETDGKRVYAHVGGRELNVAAGGEINLIFDNGFVTLASGSEEKTVYSALTPMQAARGGLNYIGKGFKGEIDYVRIFDSAETDENAELDGRLYKVFEAPESESGKLKGRTSGAWSGWSCASDGVSVDGGLNITGAVSDTVRSPGYAANKLVLEFEPSGGKAYPDHGILDTDGRVLFAHRFASDADTLYVGRGEINSAIRGAGYIADTAGQERLPSFAAEKISSGSRTDRGGVKYTDEGTIRIIAENTTWGADLAERFSDAQNYTENLAKMSEGEDVYTVSYVLAEASCATLVSESVYKGHFSGFGGIKTAGGAGGVTVSYGGLRIYTDKAGPLAESDGESVTITGLDGPAEVVFALYENGTLADVRTERTDGDGAVEVPAGFEESVIMVFSDLSSLRPVTKPLALSPGVCLTASQGQNAGAFHSLAPAEGKAVYSFELADLGSNDAGIIIGDCEKLNSSSSNYFASGSIVLLFAKGELYTRDNSAKLLRGTYTVGERLKIKIEADTEANVYDLYADGVLLAEGVPFRTAAEKLDTLALVENEGGEVFEVYNFRVKQS